VKFFGVLFLTRKREKKSGEHGRGKRRWRERKGKKQKVKRKRRERKMRSQLKFLATPLRHELGSKSWD